MSVRNILKRYWEYILAILIPVLIVFLHCITRDSWLFGDGSMLRGDAGIQYIYIYDELWNKLHTGDFSFFSWNAMGGFDFYLNALYYTVSPATIFILILPKSCLEDALQLFMVIKWSMLSFSMVYFFMHTKFNKLKANKRIVSLTLGLCYSLSSYFVFVLTFFNWMDTLVLLPYLLLLVEKMVENKKWKLYTFLLTVAICCNFYIAFPVCIFLLLWYLLQVQTVPGQMKKTFGIFFGSSVWAAVSSLVVIFPCVLNVRGRYNTSKTNDVSDYIHSVVDLPEDLIRKFFVLLNADEINTEGFYFYMSIGLVVLGMMFCFIKQNKKIKYWKLGIGIFVMISFSLGILNYIWHGFSIPHGYSQRFAFAFLLITCIMVLDVIRYAKQLKIWNCILMACVAVGLFWYAFLRIETYDEFYFYLITILLIVFYFILLVLFCKRSIKKKSFVIVCCVLCMVEICGNAYYQFKWYNAAKPDEYLFTQEAVELSNNIQLEKGQRAVLTQAVHNAGMSAGIPTMSGFVSYSNGKYIKLLYDLGMHIVQDAGCLYTGGSPLLNTMFNIGYGISAYETEVSDSVLVEKGNDLDLYKTNHSVGLGYMVKDSVKEWSSYGSASTFDIQNKFAMLATGETEELFHTFTPVDLTCSTNIGNIEQMDADTGADILNYQFVSSLEEDANIFKFTADKDMDLYVTLAHSAGAIINVKVDDETRYTSQYFSEKCILPVGKVKKGQVIEIICVVQGEKGNDIIVSVQFAEFNEDAWHSVYKRLSDSVYEITEIKSDKITGKITAYEDGIMMTSVPVMKGFKVYVDGIETSYEAIGDALIGIPLKEGKHKVEFCYSTPYAKTGWLISICSLALFIAVCVRGRKKHVSVLCESE